MHEQSPQQRPTRCRRLPPTLARAGLRLFFGGSFDPPHEGHTKLPRAVLRDLDAPDAPVIYVPAARSPHKNDHPTPAPRRLDMIELALRHTPNAWVWTEEVDRARLRPHEPSYWVRTWGIVRDAYPTGENRFLIGADQALAMHRWRDYRLFWRDAIVMLRDEHDAPERLIHALDATGAWDREELERWLAMIRPVPTIDASSTRIRDALRDDERRENPIAGLDDRVRQYILMHDLYRT